MKDKLQNKYLAWGVTAFCVLAAVILLFFAIYRWDYIIGFLATILNIMAPFIYGLALAYLLNPLVKFFDKMYKKCFKGKKTKKKMRIIRVLSLCTSTIIFVGCIVTCLSFLFPEMMKSLEMFVTNINTYLSNSKEWLIDIFGGSDAIRDFINDNYSTFSSFINDWLNDGVLNDFMTALSNGIFGTLKFLYNFVIGYVISIYVLFDKEKFKAQVKKMLYTFFDNERINIILENTRYTDKIFGDFFTGQLIDSLIVGVICFIGMLLLNIPYALIVAVIIGVTNVIPYFGPFIGAVPSALLILLVDPGKSVAFLIFIFILQQFDGNILCPKIIGNKTGLSSFWVLFSLLIFGGLFGMIGMIIGVPIFSILYSFINGLIKKRLKEKNLPVESKDYENLEYIDEETHEFVYSK